MLQAPPSYSKNRFLNSLTLLYFKPITNQESFYSFLYSQNVSVALDLFPKFAFRFCWSFFRSQHNTFSLLFLDLEVRRFLDHDDSKLSSCWSFPTFHWAYWHRWNLGALLYTLIVYWWKHDLTTFLRCYWCFQNVTYFNLAYS